MEPPFKSKPTRRRWRASDRPVRLAEGTDRKGSRLQTRPFVVSQGISTRTHRWLSAAAFFAFTLQGFCAAAQGSHCLGSLGRVEVRGNLDITARCQLSGTAVRGNVTLFAGGSLIASDVSIDGNLDAMRADFVVVEGSVIDGNVNLDELVGDRSSLENNEIGGNASLASNRSALELINNEIDGNVRVVGNVGGVSIAGNDIDGQLECSGNSPAPTGSGNRVDKGLRGQCQNLRPQPSSATPPPTTTPTTPTTPTTSAPPGDGLAARDTTPPTLTLRGAQSVRLEIDTPYTDAGAAAMDSTDGDLTSRIVVTNPVNTALIGTFTITYSVSDLSGNAATPVTRTVIVEPPPAVGGGGGGAFGMETSLALLLLLAIWRARSSRREVRRPVRDQDA